MVEYDVHMVPSLGNHVVIVSKFEAQFGFDSVLFSLKQNRIQGSILHGKTWDSHSDIKNNCTVQRGCTSFKVGNSVGNFLVLILLN